MNIKFSTQILISITGFNIKNNKKCFLSRKSAYWDDLGSMMLSNDAGNSALHEWNKLHFKISIKIQKCYFKL